MCVLPSRWLVTGGVRMMVLRRHRSSVVARTSCCGASRSSSGRPLVGTPKVQAGGASARIAGGIASVLINGHPVAVSGCAVDCGGVLLACSSAEAG